MSNLRLINEQALNSTFGYIPKFINSEIIDIQVKRDGPAILILLKTKEIVHFKPKKWDDFDVIYVYLTFYGIKSLDINNFGTQNKIQTFLVNDEGLLNINCNNNMSINFIFDFARVENITHGLIDFK